MELLRNEILGEIFVLLETPLLVSSPRNIPQEMLRQRT